MCTWHDGVNEVGAPPNVIVLQRNVKFFTFKSFFLTLKVVFFFFLFYIVIV